MRSDLVYAEGSFLVGIVLAVCLGGLVHEFGHALAAWSAGLRPRLINLGQGRVVIRARLGGAWLVIRLVPVGGYVHCLVGPETSTRQRLITTAGGPLASVLLFAVSLPLGLPAASATLWNLWVGAMTGQMFILASVLIPSKQMRNGRVSVTDALRLIWIARGDNQGTFSAMQTTYLRRYLPQGAVLPPASPHLAEILFQRSRRDRRTDGWAQDEVGASMRRILAEADLPEAERGLATDLLELSEAQQRVRIATAELAALRRTAGATSPDDRLRSRSASRKGQLR